MVNENQLFDKVILWTDIHYGLRNNSKEHNEECNAFIDWMIEDAKKNNIKDCIFLGDYFHNRSSINVSTMHYGLAGMRKLNDYFDNVWFIVGNHDLFYKNKRDITSVEFADEFSNIHLINEITDIGGCTFVPFLVGDEWESLKQKNPKYFFGHFELPGYKLNSLVQMPDHGKESDTMFNCDTLFSGHFHKRQMKSTETDTKIVYIGNCFPHNFSDAWDDARGSVILEWGEKPVFRNWPDAPKFRTADMSDVLEDPSYYLGPKVTIKVTLDIDLSVEELIFIKETYTKFYGLKDFNIVQAKNQLGSVELDGSELQAESVDTIVADQISNIDSNTLEKSLLLEIYNSL
ncbi:metallo-dependent phosphatase-like protein [Vibrio phage 2.275.O._10N.286.54.E11]|nr:metallo-dependent phosphatase-like protein [Vibrio phage 2.275.O._10N.286.54.E11]